MANKTQLATAGEQQAAIVIQKTTTSVMRSWGHI